MCIFITHMCHRLKPARQNCRYKSCSIGHNAEDRYTKSCCACSKKRYFDASLLQKDSILSLCSVARPARSATTPQCTQNCP